MVKQLLELHALFSQARSFKIYGDLLKTNELGGGVECTRLYFVSDSIRAALLVKTLLDSPEDDYLFYILGISSSQNDIEMLNLLFKIDGERDVFFSKFLFNAKEYISGVKISTSGGSFSINPSNNHYFSFTICSSGGG